MEVEDAGVPQLVEFLAAEEFLCFGAGGPDVTPAGGGDGSGGGEGVGDVGLDDGVKGEDGVEEARGVEGCLEDCLRAH